MPFFFTAHTHTQDFLKPLSFERFGLLRGLLLLFCLNCFELHAAAPSASPTTSVPSSPLLPRPSSKPPANIHFQHLLDKFDIATGSVEAIVQDSQGYIWLGAVDGLLRFDGYELRPIDKDDDSGESVKDVYNLFIDSRNDFWISTATCLLRYYPAEDRFVRFELKDNDQRNITTIHTRQMTELANGQLILGTQNGLAVIDGQSGKNYFLLHAPKNDNSLQSNDISSVMVDKNGDVWVGGSKGADRIHWPTGQITHFRSDNQGNAVITAGRVNEIKQDRWGDVWIGTSGGLNQISATTGTITHFRNDPQNPYSLSTNDVGAIMEDSQGVLWIGSDQGGLAYYDREFNQFHHYQADANTKGAIKSNTVRAIFEDRNSDLWISSYPNGINFFDRSTSVTTTYTYNPANPKSLSSNSVTSLDADRGAIGNSAAVNSNLSANGNYWIGTRTTGLNYFDRQTDTFTRFAHDPNDPHSLSSNAGIRTFVDTDGVLWVGTWGGGLNRFDKATAKFHRYSQIDPAKPGITQSHHLNSGNVRAIYQDKLNNLWLGTQYGGLNKLDRQSGIFTHYMPDPNDSSAILYDTIYCTLEDSKGRFWVGTQNSLELMDRERGTFIHYQHTRGDPTTLSSSTIYSIFEDSKARLWFGTSDGLNLFNADGKSFRHFSKHDGLYSQLIRSIAEEPDGQLWLGTGNGISSLNPDTGEIKNYYQNSGWQNGNFNTGAVAKNAQGELLFGGDNGLTILNLAELSTNSTPPPITITDFKLYTNSIKIGAEDGLLNKSIDHTAQITLNYNQSMFSFTFAALNFRDSIKNNFAYRLKGLDQEWRHVGNQRTATFTNIAPGDYEFQVIGSNNDQVWNTEGASVKIRILPPWWQTWWAYAFYALSIIGALAWVQLQQRYKRILLEEHNRKIEEQNRKLIALDKLKDDFIANTSHELRTPLNGIIGLADSLIDGAAGEVSQLMGANLQMISTSGKRLARLVNDILDFSKLKNQNIQIKPVPVNITELAKVVLTMLDKLIDNPEVTIVNKISADTPFVLADEERLQQILYNLMGNAIKFTHKGSITLACEAQGERLWISVVDTGIGIPADKVGKIFNAFEQLEDHRDRAYSGTGLGLAITKQLVEAHGSSLQVESVEGKGSSFHFSLAITALQPESARSKNRKLNSIASRIIDADSTTFDLGHRPENTQPKNSIDPDGVKPTFAGDAAVNAQFRILIVDDNPINRQVLINQLTLQQYSFAIASDGPAALKMMEDDGRFDLILLDIMMPHMSGYEVCTTLRKHHSMEDLPIIFLTAKNTIADLVSGFDVGANDFLTKPISIGELNSRVKTHLELLTINRKLEDLVTQRTQEVALAHNELATLDHIANIINQEIRLDRLLTVILYQSKILFPSASYIAFWKADDTTDHFYLTYAGSAVDSNKITHPINRSELEMYFVQPGQPLAEDIYLISEPTPIIDALNAESLLTMAFRQNGVITSLLVMGSSGSKFAVSGMQAVNYERLRNHIASALSKARLVEKLESQCDELEQMSLTDPLTGLQNRRFLTKHIDNDIALLQRKHRNHQRDHADEINETESDLVFFLMDIDNFKHINDSLGHSAGDRILMDIQRIFEPVFRASDYRIRWGGEEFLIVMRFCNREHAAKKAEQLRDAIERFNFVLNDQKVIRKTCSIGFACYPFSTSEPNALSWSQIISLADLALNAVKKSNKNGWIGITNENLNISSTDFNEIIANPSEAARDGKVTIATNLPSIKW